MNLENMSNKEQTTSVKAEHLDVEKALTLLGTWSRWRLQIYFIVGLYKGIVACWAMFGVVFIGKTPPHHCQVGAQYNTSIPTVVLRGEERLSECRVWANYTPSSNLTLPCTTGYDYSGKIRGSIVEEWDLVCDQGHYVSLSQTILVFGVASGAFTLSIFSDKFGRKTILLFSGLMLFTIGFCTAAVNNLYVFLLLRYLLGFFQQGVVLGGFVYVCELFPLAHRAFWTKVAGLGWSIGMIGQSAIAYFVLDWRHFLMVSASPGLFAIPLMWYIPESIPWLVAKGKVKDAKLALAVAARVSGVVLPPEFQPSASDTNGPYQDVFSSYRTFPAACWHNLKLGFRRERGREKAANYSLIDILRSPRLLTFAIIMAYLWCVSGLVYYGISLNAENLYGDFYVNFMLMGLTGIPGTFLAAYMLNRLGRRWSLFIFHLTAGIPLALIIFIPKVTGGTNLKPLIVTLVMIAKTAIGSCFGGVFVFTPELYPTTLRNVGMGIASVGCRVGNVIAPFTPYVTRNIEWLPNIVFGSMAIIAGFLVLLFPETKGRPLAHTVEEVESWPFLCFNNKKIGVISEKNGDLENART